MSVQQHKKVYRDTTLGTSLSSCLQELKEKGEISNELEEKIMRNFDDVFLHHKRNESSP